MKRKATSQPGRKQPKKARPSNFAPPQNAKRAITTLQSEIGYFDTPFAQDASTTPVIIDLNNMASGDTNLLRDGNKIGMLAAQLRCSYSLEATTQNVRARFVVVLDKQANGASPTWLSVFDAPTIESQRLVGNLTRYDILMDKVVSLNSTSPTVTTLQKGFFKKYLKMPNTIAAYNSGAAAVPISNSLSLIYLSDVAAGVTDMDVLGTVRLFFNR